MPEILPLFGSLRLLFAVGILAYNLRARFVERIVRSTLRVESMAQKMGPPHSTSLRRYCGGPVDVDESVFGRAPARENVYAAERESISAFTSQRKRLPKVRCSNLRAHPDAFLLLSK